MNPLLRAKFAAKIPAAIYGAKAIDFCRNPSPAIPPSSNAK
jgi:hypothetical protein